MKSVKIQERVIGRLGRHVLHDPKSRDYQAEKAEQVVDAVHKAQGLPLVQSRGSCTAEAEVGAGNATPGCTVRNQADADRLYDEEIVLEGGNPATDDPGGSGLMVCRAAKKLGWVRSYHHAFGIDHALHALVLRPVIFGVNWYQGFDSPNAAGLVEISGSIRGGHEIVALEIAAESELVWFANSWGNGYGTARPSIGLDRGGAFAMSFSTLERLLTEDGDATVPYPVTAA